MAPGVQRVLFVCTANYCRSPTVEGVFSDLVQREGLTARVQCDSAGMFDYWGASPPDPRTVAAARRRGLDLTGLRARVIAPADYASFDLLLGMERAHVEAMALQCRPEHRPKIRRFMEFVAGREDEDMPDPYGGGPAGFELVLDLALAGAAGLLAELRARWPRA